MSVLAEVFAELFSMFAGDARLSLGALAVVALAAAAAWFAAPLVAAAVLLLGSLAVLVVNVMLAAWRQT
ncbi:MAG: hypothetical protein ISS15_18270 [Alphaproteobacteria bacterium]|nr:hypothetical protein [Alphaproteobacteria bacterium]MBL7099609.1 hypothetical protein [Alphaproteobacteria bacterium]